MTEGCCGSNKYTLATQFCHTDKTVKDKCGGTVQYNPDAESCCGSSKYNRGTQFCYNSNDSKTGDLCGNNPQKSYNPDLYKCKPGTNPNGIFLKDEISYGDKNYNAVLIGTQVWMTENMKYNATGSKCGDINSYGTGILMDANTSLCNTYGRLYDWATATGSNICPSGWHIPNDAEWTTLNKFVTDNRANLKATSGWDDYSSSSGNGTDDFGFTALPGGVVMAVGNSIDVEWYFLGAGIHGGWWSSSEDNQASYWFTRNEYEEIYKDMHYKDWLGSVRCIKGQL
jgi:uncharacterized protein (TIGR02145 family)